MATWDIDVPMAGQVISNAGTEAAGYETDLSSVTTAFGIAQLNLNDSPLVLSRLAEFSESVAGPHLEKVVGHTHSALVGTSDAVRYYVAGDTEMAAEAQRNAALASYPGDIPGVSGGGGGGPR